MVSSFNVIVKLTELKNSLQKMTSDANKSFNGSDEDHCPICGRLNMVVRQPYERGVMDWDWDQGKSEYIRIESFQYECECGKTHVLLPAFIVPYCLFSLSFIVRVLYDYYTHTDSVARICEKYDISIPTLYRWKEQFLRDKEEWLGRLKNAETTEVQFLSFLIAEEHLREKLREFALKVFPHRQFLQSRQFALLHRYL